MMYFWMIVTNVQGLGEKGLDAGTFEYKGRTDAESVNISKEELLAKIAK